MSDSLQDPFKAFGKTTGQSDDEVEGPEQGNGLDEGARHSAQIEIPTDNSARLVVGLQAPVNFYKEIPRSNSLPSSDSEKGHSLKSLQRMSTPCQPSASVSTSSGSVLGESAASPQPQATLSRTVLPQPQEELPQPQAELPQTELPQATLFTSSEGVASSLTLHTASLFPSQALGIKDEDLRKFKSKELMTTLHKDILLKPTRKSHSWHCKIPVTVAGKKHVTADIFIDPSIGDDEQRAVLCVKAKMKSKLKTELHQCKKDSWLFVETQVTDSSGKRHSCSNFYPHPVKNDTWNFYQDLVECEAVRRCESNEVTLVINVTLITSQRK